MLLLSVVGCRTGKQANGSKGGDKLKAPDDQSEILFAANYVDGCALRIKGNLDEAKKLFLECYKIDPSNSAVRYELATIYRLLGANEQALFHARAAAAAEPKNEWYQLILIECYRSLKQYKQSAKLLETLVKNFPEKLEFKEDLAIEYQRLGNDEKAYKLYEDIEKVYGINEQLSLQKARLLRAQGKIREAESELIKLSQSNSMETRYYSHLADFYIELNDLPKAKAMYDKIISIEPNNPVVNLALHDYYSAQGKTEEAFECLKKAFMNPDLDVHTKASITSSFFDRDLPYYRENGMQLAQIMVQVHPETPEANAIYADYLMIEKKTREAARYYYKAAVKETGNFNVWEKLISAYSGLAQYDSVEHHSAIAMEYFPSLPTFYYYNGYANIQLGNYKKAAQSLRDGLEFVVDNKLLMIDFYQNLGDAYFFSQEYEKAYKAFEDVLKIDADNKFALNEYASFLSQRNENLERAEKLARKVNELEPDNRTYMDTYGWILYQLKRYKEAEAWLGGAVKLGTKKPIILEHYGDVLYRLNKPEEALKMWEAARTAGGKSEALLKKIKEKKLDD